jgi:hypothetical protein
MLPFSLLRKSEEYGQGKNKKKMNLVKDTTNKFFVKKKSASLGNRSVTGG